MCGVLAILRLSPEARLPSRERMERALAAMAHRGPDGQGLWIDEAAGIALGHRRLAIRGGASGAQPIASADGAIRAVINGELYDHHAAQARLAAAGARFQTESDSELLVHLYRERGHETPSELRGEFAFALWDGPRRRLLLARDRFGVKPLAWARHDGLLLVASEAKALFALGLPARWDLTSVEHIFTHQYLPAGRTLFAGVHRLKGAHRLLARADHPEPARPELWWRLDGPDSDQSRQDPPESGPEDLRAVLETAVRRRLIGDARVACALSGGIDSSAVAALAGRVARDTGAAPPPCFGLTFPGGGQQDEEAFARQTAAHAGLEFHALPMDGERLFRALPEAVRHAEGHAINGHLPAKFLLSKAVRDAGCRVILTGEGADELLLGYPHFRQDHFRPDHSRQDHGLAASVAASPAGLESARGPSGLGAAGIDARFAACRGVMVAETRADRPLAELLQARLGFVPAFLAAKLALAATLDDWAAEDSPIPPGGNAGGAELRLRRLAGYLEALPADALAPSGSRAERAARIWTRTALEDSILRTLGDGTEMAHGVEGRPPFLDTEVWRVSRRLPLSLRLPAKPSGLSKEALREACRGLLPETVRLRPKQPFIAPPLMIGPDGRPPRALTALLDDGLLDGCPFFAGDRARARLERLASADLDARRRAEPALMIVLTLALIQDQLGLRLPSSSALADPRTPETLP